MLLLPRERTYETGVSEVQADKYGGMVTTSQGAPRSQEQSVVARVVENKLWGVEASVAA